MFGQMTDGWFRDFMPEYNDFVKAMLTGDIKAMNAYMNKMALNTISYFDSGRKPSEESEPERFYHGFVLGLTVELSERYVITSNRESGFGRYDVVLEPKTQEDCAVIMEFKVHDNEYSLSPQFIHVFFLVCHIHLFIWVFTVWCDDGKRIG